MGLAHLAALVSMILRCMTVKTVKLVDPAEMRKTDSFGETRLVLHVAHHELESVIIIVICIPSRQACKSACMV